MAPPSHDSAPAAISQGIARGLALFFGAFCLLNLIGEWRHRGFDANAWWIDMGPIPSGASKVLLLLIALALLGYAIRPRQNLWPRRLTLGVLWLTLGLAFGNVLQFYHLLARGSIRSSFPLPLSLLIGGAIAWIIVAILRPPRPAATPRTGWRRYVLHPRTALALTVAACAILFPLAQIFSFGKTDYRRPADVALVFGARVYHDGRLSDALADRTRTACGLYHQGLVSALIFSGGPGDGEIDEPSAMRAAALGWGVPDYAIYLDPDGLNTDATVRNAARIFAGPDRPRIVAVSHFYHLPRIKLTCQRVGLDVYTVPAQETYTLTKMPYLIAREVAALWFYYLRPLTRSPSP